MKKFILIDHSITKIGGHHYEYAIRVLDAARDAGYTPILSTNRRFKSDTELPIKTYPKYRYGYWVVSSDSRSYSLLRSLRRKAQRVIFLTKNRIRFSPIGLLWVNRRRPVSLLQSAVTPSMPLLFLLGILVYFGALAYGLYRLIRAAIPFKPYLRSIGSALKRLFKITVLPLIVALRPPQWLGRWLADQRKGRAFGEDTVSLFRELKLSEGDVVFIPTLGEPEMLGLLNFFKRDLASCRPTWHLLFRRNIYTGRAPQYKVQEEGNRPLRNAFRQFTQNLSGQKVYFCTDTDQLTDQYNRLGVGEFRTVSIPVQTEYRPKESLSTPHTPVRITYVGDARTEKGYHYLPQVVEDLWLDYVKPGQVEFQLQSYFNTPKGEAAAVVALSQLQQYDSERVKLVRTPLSTNEYRQKVVNSDVVLVLYDQENYSARSSGIFVEALVAGKPVVVPAGTWMSLQLSDVIYDYHKSLLQQCQVLEKISGKGIRWNTRASAKIPDPKSDELTIWQTEPRRAWVEVPTGTSHLLVTFRQDGHPDGQHVSVKLQQYDLADRILTRSEAVTGGKAGYHSILVPTASDLYQIKITLECALSTPVTSISDLTITSIQSDSDLPISTVGTIYGDTSQISSCVKEIVEHIEHYENSARQFSDAWAAYHNSDMLVRQLIDPECITSTPSFSIVGER